MSALLYALSSRNDLYQVSVLPRLFERGDGFGVEPLSTFLAAKKPGDFDEMATRWQAADGFRPEYKAAKLERIAQLKALKLAEC